LVVVVGKGQVLEKFPLVAVVGSETCRIMMVVVMVRGMMIHIII